MAGDAPPAMNGVALTVGGHPAPMVEGDPAALSLANGLGVGVHSPGELFV